MPSGLAFVGQGVDKKREKRMGAKKKTEARSEGEGGNTASRPLKVGDDPANVEGAGLAWRSGQKYWGRGVCKSNLAVDGETLKENMNAERIGEIKKKTKKNRP